MGFEQRAITVKQRRADNDLYKTVQICAVSVVQRGDEWVVLGYPSDWNLTHSHPYTIASCATVEEAEAKWHQYDQRLRDGTGTLKPFPRGVRRHLYEFLLP